jgi:hypothetical protein
LILVLLQPFTYDPTEKNKHKFMVQYLYLNEQEIQMSVNDILNMWKDISPTRLLDLKLRCVFEYTEQEQQKLVQQQQQFTNEQQPAQPQQPPQQQQQQQLSSNQSKSNVNRPSSLQSANRSNNDAYVSASNEQHNASDFDSTTIAAPAKTFTTSAGGNTLSSSPASLRQDKNDNVLNEIKLIRQENEQLKKENRILKVN